MEKYQLYRTALDALQFLLSSELGYSEDIVLSLKQAYWKICDDIHYLQVLNSDKDASEDA